MLPWQADSVDLGVAVMVREKYGVRLTPRTVEGLQHLVRGGKSPARVTVRARILLKTGDGWSAPRVPWTFRWAHGIPNQGRFAEGGLEGVLKDPPGQPAPQVGRLGRGPPGPLACSPAPAGQTTCDPAPVGWEGGGVGEIGLLHVPRGSAPASQKNALKPWQKKEWCIPKVSASS